MDKEEFFRNYIPALEKALDYEKQIDFEVIGPDRFIEDNMLRNELDVFENENYREYENLFYLVSVYFDAKIHNLENVDEKNIAITKDDIRNEIEKIKKYL